MNIGEKLIVGSIVALAVSSILTGSCLYNIYDKLETGDHLKNARVNFTLHPETPWAQIPVFLREQIALQHPATRMDKSDLTDIVAFYNHLIATYDKRAISIAGAVDAEGKLVKESVE